METVHGCFREQKGGQSRLVKEGRSEESLLFRHNAPNKWLVFKWLVFVGHSTLRDLERPARGERPLGPVPAWWTLLLRGRATDDSLRGWVEPEGLALSARNAFALLEEINRKSIEMP